MDSITTGAARFPRAGCGLRGPSPSNVHVPGLPPRSTCACPLNICRVPLCRGTFRLSQGFCDSCGVPKGLSLPAESLPRHLALGNVPSVPKVPHDGLTTFRVESIGFRVVDSLDNRGYCGVNRLFALPDCRRVAIFSPQRKSPAGGKPGRAAALLVVIRMECGAGVWQVKSRGTGLRR
jgi:hypothetical protein